MLNGTQRCGGIGEIMVPLAPMEPCTLLIAKPSLCISTPEAYSLVDRMPDGGARYTEAMVRALERRDLPAVARCLGNRFEDALCRPQVQALRAAMLGGGALNARMTGSGSAVFGISPIPRPLAGRRPRSRGRCEAVFLARPVSAEEAAL